MSDLGLTSPPTERAIRRRTRRDPLPRFKADVTKQLDAVRGCPALQVGEDHVARRVLEVVARFDLSTVESGYSSLGRHGYAPRSVLAVWVYASLIGVHHATKLARLLDTDAALRLLSGGHRISRSTLNEFRQRHGELFGELITQTVAMAQTEGLLDVEDLAADSMRLRAHASSGAVRTLARSKKRLEELSRVDESRLSEGEREEHYAKVLKHTSAIAECERLARSSIVTTNPSAALMKFPDGAGLAGHRISAMAAGVQARFVVAVLVTAETNDYGSLKPLVDATRETLSRVGMPAQIKLQVAADAGYCTLEDLVYADGIREQTDILVAGAAAPGRTSRFFGREHFTVEADGSVHCPAGRRMRGPARTPDGQHWKGVGCSDCPLRPQCTDGKYRSFVINPELERVRAAMRERMAAADAAARYNRRIATIEPVFSNIESTLAYRRASSRFAKTVVAEVLLKVLAHNVSRLLAARRLLRVLFVLTADGRLVPL